MIDAIQKEADLIFLALVVWRESRGETNEVRSGVAYSILNRVKRPSWWGNDVMSVVFKKWQYSSMTDPHDAQLVVWPQANDVSWQQCMDVASGVINGTIVNLVNGADSYYDISIPAPKWASPETFVTQLGKIRFYDLDKDVER